MIRLCAIYSLISLQQHVLSARIFNMFWALVSSEIFNVGYP